MRGVLKKCLIAGIVVLAAVSGYVCGSRRRAEELAGQVPAVQSEVADKLATFRTDRQLLRQNQINRLNELIHTYADAQMVSLAQQKLLELMSCEEQELALEGMLTLRGFEDVLVVIHSGSANIMLRNEALTAQQTAVILEMITRETGISAGNVKIIPII